MICRHKDRGTKGVVARGDMPSRFQGLPVENNMLQPARGEQENLEGRSVGMAGQHELLELDLQFSQDTGYATPGLTLVDSGASHNSLSERVALAVGLCVDFSCHLNVKLVDGEQCGSLGLARGVQVIFSPGVVQPWDLWVVPLAMDAVLGAPWLRGVQPTIDWKIQCVMWELNGSVMTAFGSGGLPPTPPIS